jgi:hypothetical protein
LPLICRASHNVGTDHLYRRISLGRDNVGKLAALAATLEQSPEKGALVKSLIFQGYWGGRGDHEGSSGHICKIIAGASNIVSLSLISGDLATLTPGACAVLAKLARLDLFQALPNINMIALLQACPELKSLSIVRKDMQSSVKRMVDAARAAGGGGLDINALLSQISMDTDEDEVADSPSLPWEHFVALRTDETIASSSFWAALFFDAKPKILSSTQFRAAACSPWCSWATT